ncbi:hypothetical protein [Coxiella endosymbiont of Ornithodoros maritimus]|nr:hypothetical protein [Coxiella endosymbiont of Ornithodoros maritimus]
MPSRLQRQVMAVPLVEQGAHKRM